MLCEKQLAWSRIWTRVAVSISYDDNHYTTGTSIVVIIIIIINFFASNNNSWNYICNKIITIIKFFVLDKNTAPLA